MIKYYIYHIKGKKIGCTQSLEYRLKRQHCNDYEILETHTDIMVASERELQLQKEYGYLVDTVPYYQSYKLCDKLTFESRSKGGKTAGKIVGNKWGKINGKKNLESGHWARISKLSAETRKKTIIQYNKSGDFIAEWESATVAESELKIGRTNIIACLKCKTTSAGGYVWKYKP
jgi:hypothetical protein